jgi:hypothetical protein
MLVAREELPHLGIGVVALIRLRRPNGEWVIGRLEACPETMDDLDEDGRFVYLRVSLFAEEGGGSRRGIWIYTLGCLETS